MKRESLYKIATLVGNSPESCRRHYAALLAESLLSSVEFCDEPEEPEVPPPVSGRLRLYLLPKPRRDGR